MSTFKSIAEQLSALNDLETSGLSPNVIQPTFNVTNVNPPTEVYVTTDDVVVVAGWNSAPSQTLIVTVRFLIASGPTILGQYTYTLPSDRSFWTHSIPMTNGYMLAVTVDLIPTGGILAQRGQCYCQCNIQRQGAAPQIESFVLFSDYVSADLSPSWPSYTSISSVSGIGAIRTISGTTPAAGAGLNATVPTNARWRWHHIYFFYQASATVATRQVWLYFTDQAGNIFYYYVSPTTQAAGQGYNYSFSIGLGFQVQAASSVMTSLPIIDSDGGWLMHAGANAMQAGDQISSPTYAVEEWIDPGT